MMSRIRLCVLYLILQFTRATGQVSPMTFFANPRRQSAITKLKQVIITTVEPTKNRQFCIFGANFSFRKVIIAILGTLKTYYMQFAKNRRFSGVRLKQEKGQPQYLQFETREFQHNLITRCGLRLG